MLARSSPIDRTGSVRLRVSFGGQPWLVRFDFCAASCGLALPLGSSTRMPRQKELFAGEAHFGIRVRDFQLLSGSGEIPEAVNLASPWGRGKVQHKRIER